MIMPGFSNGHDYDNSDDHIHALVLLNIDYVLTPCVSCYKRGLDTQLLQPQVYSLVTALSLIRPISLP